MRNKIDFRVPPDALFLDPWHDPGVELLRDPDFVWRTLPQTRIKGFSASAHEPIRRKIESFLKVTERTKTFSSAIEYESVPVVLTNASFRKSFVLAEDKLFLTGAAGIRALNRYRWENEDAGDEADVILETYFQELRDADHYDGLPVVLTNLEPDIDLAIPCRNTFNYYHFITESLCQLTLLDELEFSGNVYFHFPNQEDRQQPFAKKFVDALFPELAGRVFFERAPKDYERVLACYDMVGGHYQAPVSSTAGMNDLLPGPLLEKGGATSPASRVPLSVNAVNSSLLALRERALKAIEGQNFNHLPKRFFVGRDERKSRARHMEGEDVLYEHLALFGFEYVVFENLSPLEQIAIMANAEVMVSYHGAGFTNMIFANPKAYVIELGTLQTAQFRWGDFWPLANAAQCNYINFFADFRTENPLVEPHFSTDGIVPVSLSEAAIGQVVSFIVTLLGHVPELKTSSTVGRLAREVLQAGGAEQAVALLEKHAAMLDDNAELCMLKADCHKELDEPKSELVALDLAYKADPTRWQTLVRIIWCANRCNRPQVIRWALSRLKSKFPQRHDAFVGNHEWVRYVA